jgi:hypothetical protein
VVEITSMNHGFAVDNATLPEGVEETHVSLFDGSNCGISITGQEGVRRAVPPRGQPRAAGQLLPVREVRGDVRTPRRSPGQLAAGGRSAVESQASTWSRKAPNRFLGHAVREYDGKWCISACFVQEATEGAMPKRTGTADISILVMPKRTDIGPILVIGAGGQASSTIRARRRSRR